MNLNYFLKKFLRIKKRIFLDPEYKKFIKIFGKRNHHYTKGKDIVIMELVEIILFLTHFYYLKIKI